MRVRFWGTRGSIAKPGASTVRYGGNTSCVEVRSAGGTLVVLDIGTGAHGLGQALMGEPRPLRGHILISHTHWDHIQGFPFFAPLFVPGNEWDVYAPRGLWDSLGDTLAGQMQSTYFPVTLDQLGATVRFHDLLEGDFQVGDMAVTAHYLNHPALTLGYRLHADGATLVYATDHEPHARTLAAGSQGTPWSDADEAHVQFVAGADLLIHDTQYTAAEYPTKVGWGHSTVEYVADVAARAGVRRLALFHHDPLRDDAAVDALVEAARVRLRDAGGEAEVFAAAEGQSLELTPAAPAPAAAPQARSDALREPQDLGERPVLVASDDAALLERLVEAVRAEGLNAVLATGGHQVSALLAAEAPAALLVQRDLAGLDAFALRSTLDAAVAAETPWLVVARTDNAADRADGERLGLTEWLVEPFTRQYACARLRACLLRQACRWVPAVPPPDEAERLTALRALDVLDTPPEPRLDRLTRLAQRIFEVPIALVSLVDAERQWFKSRQGLEARETPRDMAFCAHAIRQEETFVVQDALLDPRFAHNPLVTGQPRVRFYAGHPVRAPDGSKVGTLCVLDHRPRQLTDEMSETLRDLAGLVEQELAAGSQPR